MRLRTNCAIVFLDQLGLISSFRMGRKSARDQRHGYFVGTFFWNSLFCRNFFLRSDKKLLFEQKLPTKNCTCSKKFRQKIDIHTISSDKKLFFSCEYFRQKNYFFKKGCTKRNTFCKSRLILTRQHRMMRFCIHVFFRPKIFVTCWWHVLYNPLE